MKSLFLSLLIVFLYLPLNAQDDVTKLVGALLAETPLEEDLFELTDQIGGRVTGSENNEKSVEWGLKKFQDAGVNAWKDDFEMESYWFEHICRGSVSNRARDYVFEVDIVSKFKTPAGLFTGKMVNVGMGQEADFEGKEEEIKGNIIIVETDLCLDISGLFHEYDMATKTEVLADKYGASGIVFMSSRPRGLLYRFITSKGMDSQLPQYIMAREDAKRCQRLLANGEKQLKIDIASDVEVGDEYTSHNVIAEIKGSEKPDEIVIIGAHLDSWALGTGANDNGCNVSMMIDIARQMKKLGIQPKRTIRFALWNGEEQGYFGSWDYTKDHLKEMDNHIMALSIDIGSGGIMGFFTNGRDELIPVVDKVLKPVAALGDFYNINAPIVGTDNFDFMLQGVANLVGNHQAQLYGPNYHAASDTYDKVDLKSLKRNSAIVAALTLGFANLEEEEITWKRHTRADIDAMLVRFNVEYQMRMFNVWQPWADGVRGRK